MRNRASFVRIWAPACVLGALFFLVAIDGAQAQLRDYLTGQAGVNRPLLYFASVDRQTCAGTPLTVLLKGSPAHGSVTIAEGEQEIAPKQLPNCVGVKARATIVRYTPKPGTSGLDRYWIYVAGGNPAERGLFHEVVVWITAPDQKNTLPPQRVDIDKMLGPPSLVPVSTALGGQPQTGDVAVGMAASRVHVRTRQIIIRDTEVDSATAAVGAGVSRPAPAQ